MKKRIKIVEIVVVAALALLIVPIANCCFNNDNEVKTEETKFEPIVIEEEEEVAESTLVFESAPPEEDIVYDLPSYVDDPEVEELHEEDTFGMTEDDIEEFWDYTATFTITHYCPCEKCCGQWAGGPTASGVMPQANHTIAVDPNVIPMGSEVLINGHIYISEDTGGAIKQYRIDIYCDSHQEALELGIYDTEVSWRAPKDDN